MDFKNISNKYYPVYAWYWNTKITEDGIKKQIDEMYSSGVRSFYVLAEPENFRPETRKTHLSPEYLSDEYFKLLVFAYEYSKKYDMDMWLYNEGGFPSGMACGKIKESYPHLAMRTLKSFETPLKKGEIYKAEPNVIYAVMNGEKIENGAVLLEDAVVTEYKNIKVAGIRTDIARPENTEVFLEITHKQMYNYFGDEMGSNIRLMFDDEAHMAGWTDGMEKIFYEKYGYSICEFAPFIADNRKIKPENDAQYKAVSDYVMLCGELMRNNYFMPMKIWLNQYNMLSTGHLDNDNYVNGGYRLRYGNILETLRCYDVPGIDVIWNQIEFLKGVNDGYEFFPRIASSAANQLGHSMALSESMAVCGSQVTPENIRYIVNHQAVRGISVFNFLAVSYDRKSAMCMQFRPNFIPENPGMDCLEEINTYTARISQILQKSRPEIKTALYFPFRTIAAGGIKAEISADSFEKLGNYLEKEGVSFDLIDEEFVLSAEKIDGGLTGENVRYENIFVPDNMFFENDEVLKKLSGLKNEVKPCVIRKSEHIQARKIIFENGEEAYFICNLSAEDIVETIEFYSDKTPYIVNLQTGDIYFTDYEYAENKTKISLSFPKGEAKLIYFTDENIDVKKEIEYVDCIEVSDIKAYISREFVFGDDEFKNVFYKPYEREIASGEWEKEFSGEVVYTFTVPDIPESEFTLNLGEVRYFAKVYLNDKKVGEVTMNPYSVDMCGVSKGDEIKIIVSNTIANACASANYFEKQDIKDVGPYHEKMVLFEKEAPPGGLIGPIRIMLFGK